MELDDIKKVWQVKKTFNIQTDEGMIKKILEVQNQTVLSKLVKYIKWEAIMLIAALTLFCNLPTPQSFIKAGGIYLFWIMLYVVFCIGGIVESIYKYKYISRINFLTMGVKDVYNKLSKYYNYMEKWRLYGVIGLIIYLGIFFYLDSLLKKWALIDNGYLLIFLIAVISVGAWVAWLMIGRTMKMTNVIRQNLKEIEEFQKESDE